MRDKRKIKRLRRTYYKNALRELYMEGYTSRWKSITMARYRKYIKSCNQLNHHEKNISARAIKHNNEMSRVISIYRDLYEKR